MGRREKKKKKGHKKKKNMGHLWLELVDLIAASGDLALAYALFGAQLADMMVPSFLWWPLAICYIEKEYDLSFRMLANIGMVIFCNVFVLVSYLMSWSWVTTLARVGNAMLICITVFRYVRFSISPCSGGRPRRFTILPARFDDWCNRSWFGDLLDRLVSPFVTVHQYHYEANDILPSTHKLSIQVENIVARIVGDGIQNYNYDQLGKDPSTTHEVTIGVENLVARIADGIQNYELGKDHLPPVELKILVVDRPYRQASASDARKITIFTGYLKPFDAMVAGNVIAHEIAHIIARHGEEKENYNLLLWCIWAGLSFISFHPWVYFGSAVMDFVLRMALSRRIEEEADYLGFLLAASAGYEPEEQLMKSFEKEDGSLVDWFATHPCEAKRIELLNKPKVLQIANRMYHASIQI